MRSAVSESVNTSEIGVMIADIASMITMAWLRYLRINSADRNPNLANPANIIRLFLFASQDVSKNTFEDAIALFTTTVPYVSKHCSD